MCTLIALHRCYPDASLVVAANRDEYLDRPAEGPALRALGEDWILSPRDKKAGGTWLGLNRAGLFAALTNRPNPSPDATRRSRGLLVHDALESPSAEQAAERLERLPSGAYNPFNLFVSDGRDAFTVIYQDEARLLELSAGAHVIGNADPDDRDVPKIAGLLRRAEKVATGPAERALEDLAEICRSHEGEAPGEPLRDTCIHAGGYGTRCSTLFKRGLRPAEHVFRFAEGPPCETEYRDMTPLLDELDRKTGSDSGAKARTVA